MFSPPILPADSSSKSDIPEQRPLEKGQLRMTNKVIVLTENPEKKGEESIKKSIQNFSDELSALENSEKTIKASASPPIGSKLVDIQDALLSSMKKEGAAQLEELNSNPQPSFPIDQRSKQLNHLFDEMNNKQVGNFSNEQKLVIEVPHFSGEESVNGENDPFGEAFDVETQAEQVDVKDNQVDVKEKISSDDVSKGVETETKGKETETKGEETEGKKLVEAEVVKVEKKKLKLEIK